MKIDKTGSEAVIYPAGKIDISNAEEFKNQVVSLIEEGRVNICIDFTEVSGVDSSGVGKLLVSRKKINESGGRLRIRNLIEKDVRELFYVLDLHKVIEIEELPE